MNKYLAPLLFVIMICFRGGQAQDTIATDSLNLTIRKAVTDYEINAVFDQLSKRMESLSNKQALRIALRSLEEAEKSDYTLSQIFAHRNLGQIYNRLGNKVEALRHFQEAIDIGRNNKDQRFGLAVSLLHFGQFLSFQGLYAEGLQNLLDASRIFESLRLYSYVILCHYEAMLIQYNAKNHKQCIEEGYHVLSFQEKLPANEINSGTEFQKMSTLNTIALCNSDLKQYDIAIINYEKAESIARKIKNEFWIGLINGNKGSVLKNLGREDEAIVSLMADYHTSMKFQEWGSAALAALSISEIHIKRKNYGRAQQLLDSAHYMFRFEKSAIIARKGMAVYLNDYARLKAATNDYPEAYRAMARHVELRDSLSHEQERLNMSKIRASYDLDRKQNEIELLTKNNEIQQERIRSQRTLFIATLVVLILVIILSVNLVYNFRRQKNIFQLLRQQRDEIEAKNSELEAQGTKLQENNQYIQSLNAKLEQKVVERTRELEETNKELDTFLYHSSHDIRGPITTLLGLDQVARYVSSEREVTMLFDKVAETARSMDSMLFKMQMVYELNKPDHPFEIIDINKIILDVVEHFRPDFQGIGMTNHTTMPDSIKIFSNQALLNIVFRNLLENAIMFRKDQPGAEPYVDISVKKGTNEIEISIMDNGIGIDERYQTQVFDLYFRGSQASKGNGLGLYLVQKTLKKLNGSVSMMSDYGVGSTFTILLPVVQ
jgi:signal transduction histidine kinase